MAASAHPFSESYNNYINIQQFDFDFGLQGSQERDDSSPQTEAPRHSLLDFRNQQRSPALAPSLDFDYRRVKRKQSRADLAELCSDQLSFAESITCQPPLLHSAPPAHHFLPPLLPPLPSTPQTHAAAASPSLSSTITTLQSTPTRTPLQPGGLSHEQRSREGDLGRSEPIRTKRKFETFKRAKRLPVRASGGESVIWQVHAAVVDLSGEQSNTGRDVTSATERVPARGAPARVALEDATAEARTGRSVRFTGIGARGSSEVARNGDSGDEKDTIIDSTFTLSKFKFPAPPNCNWTGSFGHLNDATPPTSPATLHYRGASFDVVNPHHSLLLGAKGFETPAEIDGLLDDYFQISDQSLSQSDDASMDSSQISLPSSERSRKMKMFEDMSSAHRHILRRAECENSPTRTGYPMGPDTMMDDDQDIPVPDLTQQTTDEIADEPKITGSGSEKSTRTIVAAAEPKYEPSVDRGSSVYPHSHFSYPFDLHLSEGPIERQFDKIDHMVNSGYGHYIDAFGHHGGHGDEEGTAGKHEGADANAESTQVEHDTTLSDLLEQYDYTRSQNGAAAVAGGLADSSGSPPSPPSAEQVRSFPSHNHDISISPLSLKEEHSIEGTGQRSPVRRLSSNPYHRKGSRLSAVLQRRVSPLPMLPPMLPLPALPVRAYPPVMQETSDLQTSQQTYGGTEELLGISPINRQVISNLHTPRAECGSGFGLRHPKMSPGRYEEAVGKTPPLYRTEDHPNLHGGRVPESESGHLFHASRSGRKLCSVADDGDEWVDISLKEEEDRHEFYGSECSSGDSHADTSTDGDGAFRFPSKPAPSRKTFTVSGHGVERAKVEAAQKAHDVRRVVELLDSKMLNNELLSIGEATTAKRERRQKEDTEIRMYRTQKPDAFQEASNVIASRHDALSMAGIPPSNSWRGWRKYIPMSPKTKIRPASDLRKGIANNSFESVLRKAKALEGDAHSSTSHDARLLGVSGGNNLKLMASHNTVTTTRGTGTYSPSTIPAHPQTTWSPLAPNSILDPMYDVDAIGLVPSSGTSGPTAIRSQRTLLPLQLQVQNLVQSPRNAIGEVHRPANSMASGWRSEVHTLACDNDCGHLLLNPTLARVDPQMLAEQKQISGKILLLCYFCPPLAIAFYCGGLDWLARRLSKGRVVGMGEWQKRRALRIALPTALLAWSFFGVLIAVLVALFAFPH